MSDGFAGYRARLVEELRSRGVEDLAVLRAFGVTPRHLFVPEALRARAYEDAALPIGRGQTISQPSTHAAYLQSLRLRGHERVLEIGTGTGYQTALLACLVAQVFSVERIPALATQARSALTAAGIANVTVLTGDGTLGWRPFAPYDAILVAAAGPQVPQPLVEQLADGGALIMPIQRSQTQELLRVTRHGHQVRSEAMGGAEFVPLIGRYGFGVKAE
jgi:protein-L-isoaspartate(D-aspartate) O-methyltransferase